jgi:hypothetical protein
MRKKKFLGGKLPGFQNPDNGKIPQTGKSFSAYTGDKMAVYL